MGGWGWGWDVTHFRSWKGRFSRLARKKIELKAMRLCLWDESSWVWPKESSRCVYHGETVRWHSKSRRFSCSADPQPQKPVASEADRDVPCGGEKSVSQNGGPPRLARNGEGVEALCICLKVRGFTFLVCWHVHVRLLVWPWTYCISFFLNACLSISQSDPQKEERFTYLFIYI